MRIRILKWSHLYNIGLYLKELKQKRFKHTHQIYRYGKIISTLGLCIFSCSTWKWKWNCSVVSDSLRPHGLAYQASPSMGFYRQVYWSGLPFPSPTVMITVMICVIICLSYLLPLWLCGYCSFLCSQIGQSLEQGLANLWPVSYFCTAQELMAFAFLYGWKRTVFHHTLKLYEI